MSADAGMQMGLSDSQPRITSVSVRVSLASDSKAIVLRDLQPGKHNVQRISSEAGRQIETRWEQSNDFQTTQNTN
jgi:hypothetical protein